MTEEKFSKSAPLLGGLAKLILAGCSRLPIGMAQRLGSGLGHLSWLLPNRMRAVSSYNIDLCFPELAPAERRRLVKRSLIETGKTATELGAFWSWSMDRLAGLEEGIENEELLSGCLEGDSGFILLVPHIGNWEFFNHFLMRRRPFLALYRRPRVRQLDSVLRQARERTGCRMAPADREGLRQIHRELVGGGVVMILPDQEPLKKHGVFAPFFGVPALTMTLVARLCQRLDSRVLYGFAERRPRGRFRVHFRPAPEGLGDLDLEAAVTRMNQGAEDCVRSCPEQYQWSYRRFRTRPPGESAAVDATSASGERCR
jgi:KDO2-lipid IV(A) lauroyltransferase